MSKNTRSSDFRKVDVDELDEDKFRDEQEESQSEDDNGISKRESECKSLTQSGKNFDALKVALDSPPLKCKDEALKKRNFNVVLDVLTRYKSSEIEDAVKKLNSEEIDTLVKYLYRGFSEPTENSCGSLLAWHQHAVAQGGLGSIMRVMTSRNTV